MEGGWGGVSAPQHVMCHPHDPREKVGMWEEMPIFGMKDDDGFYYSVCPSPVSQCVDSITVIK